MGSPVYKLINGESDMATEENKNEDMKSDNTPAPETPKKEDVAKAEETPKKEESPKAEATPSAPEESKSHKAMEKCKEGMECFRHEMACTLRPPKEHSAKMLWWGLMLIMIPFAIKLLTVGIIGTKVKDQLEEAKVGTQMRVERNKIMSDANELRRDMSDLQSRKFEDGVTTEQREKIDEQIKEKDKELKELEKENKDDLKKIQKKYGKKREKAEMKALKSAAKGIAWLQRSLWFKFFLDIPRLLGCFIIVFTTLSIVNDPRANGYYKTFAIVCSTVVLIMSTVWAFAAYLT